MESGVTIPGVTNYLDVVYQFYVNITFMSCAWFMLLFFVSRCLKNNHFRHLACNRMFRKQLINIKDSTQSDSYGTNIYKSYLAYGKDLSTHYVDYLSTYLLVDERVSRLVNARVIRRVGVALVSLGAFRGRSSLPWVLVSCNCGRFKHVPLAPW